MKPTRLRLAYRLLDPNSGAVVVPDLYHLQGGNWTTRALLPGYPGSTMIGDFAIPLPAPGSVQHGRYRSQYDAILNSAKAGIGLKVEGYLGDINAGDPVVSGVITGMDLPLDGPWVLSGSDTLYWLQQSQLFPGEEGTLFADTYTAHDVAANFFGTSELLMDDDFAGGSSDITGNYNNSGFSAATDPIFGRPAVTATVDDSHLTRNTTFTREQFGANYSPFEAAQATAWGMLTGSGTFAGIWMLADATAQNGILAELGMSTTSGVNNIDAYIYTRVAGTYTLRASVAGVISNVPTKFPFQLDVVTYGSTTPGTVTKVATRVLINGKDSGCVFYDFIEWTVPASGRVGLRYGTGPGSPVYFNRLRLQTRVDTAQVTAGVGTQRFKSGSSYSGVLLGSSVGGAGQTHLDMVTAAASWDSAQVRKDPKPGAKADAINYGLSLGTDYSKAIVLEEGVNVVAQGSTFANVAEVYADETRLRTVPFGDSGGGMTWSPVGSLGDMVLVDTVSDVGTVGFTFALQYVRAIQARKASPLAATQLTVIRTSKLLGVNNGFGPRELDFVQVHLPTYNIRHQSAQIVGYTLTEGAGTITYYLTQFPASSLPEALFQRLNRTADYLSSTYKAR